MARSARHRALDAFLHRLRPPPAIALLRSFPAWQEQRLGQAAAGAAAGAPRRSLRRARGERMAAQAHQMDTVLSRRGRWRAFALPTLPRKRGREGWGQKEKVGHSFRRYGRWS